ncbi:hypothetical protein [Serratia sp. Se-RSBMAAmG]|uniref:hypothetical protein n=1 Tax=Serratia sp. Se-RSBMAAmG TaxID=3043305 RepID=UPI0024AF1839|nr:hypothetical protein [Serratia sp. Se-RSBMAAmG]MDI6976558.1 hypothetical protein [Serratia sp. Se-RSBMAAmG]
MLIIEDSKITKSGVELSDGDVLKYIDESFLVNKNGELVKEITLLQVRDILLSYPSLVKEYRYLEDLMLSINKLGDDSATHEQKISELGYVVNIYTKEGVNTRIPFLGVLREGDLSSTAFIKMSEMYRLPIRFGIYKKIKVVEGVEEIEEVFEDDVMFSEFLETLSLDLDVMDDDEIDHYLGIAKREGDSQIEFDEQV